MHEMVNETLVVHFSLNYKEYEHSALSMFPRNGNYMNSSPLTYVPQTVTHTQIYLTDTASMLLHVLLFLLESLFLFFQL